MQLSDAQVEAIRTSFARVAALGDAAGELFYRRLFEAAPELRGLFPERIGGQASKLTTALALVVANLRNWQKVGPVLDDLARRHVAYGARPEHYPVVGAVLLDVLAEALGPDFTPAHRAAWGRAYAAIAERMIRAAEAEAA